MAPKSREEIAEAITTCATELLNESRDGAPLRRLQAALRGYSRDSDQDPEGRVIAYLLNVWIEKYYAQLAGWVPPELSKGMHGLRLSLTKENAAPLLRLVAETLNKSSDSPWPAMQDLFHAYLRTLDAAELLTPNVAD